MIFPLKASIMKREREREREICRRCVIAISMVLIEVPDSIFNFNNIPKKKKKTEELDNSEKWLEHQQFQFPLHSHSHSQHPFPEFFL